MIQKILRYKDGFTLIELLVVISIIGILAAFGMVSFTASQRQARDTQRKSDIKQFQTALEAFANKNSGLYPARTDSSGAEASTILCSDLGLTSCPVDPKNSVDASYSYKYQSDGTVSNGSATGTKYVLWGKLENSSNYWVNCSNGKSGQITTVGFSVSGGQCPL